MPERTTIVMPPHLKARAVARARQQKISFGEFVRRAVEKQLAAPVSKTGDPFWDNLRIIDDDGPADMSARIDDYVYEGLEDELRRQRRDSGAVFPKRPAPQRGAPVVADARAA